MWGRTVQGGLDGLRCGGSRVCVREWGGGSSIVTTRKQSNTNSSHSRGTAGAHIDSFLGGPGGSEKEIVRAWARMKDREIERDGEGFGRGQRC